VQVRACRAPFCHPPERFRCPFQPDHLMRLCEQKRHGFLSAVTTAALVEGPRECAGCYSYDCVVFGALNTKHRWFCKPAGHRNPRCGPMQTKSIPPAGRPAVRGTGPVASHAVAVVSSSARNSGGPRHLCNFATRLVMYVYRLRQVRRALNLDPEPSTMQICNACVACRPWKQTGSRVATADGVVADHGRSSHRPLFQISHWQCLGVSVQSGESIGCHQVWPDKDCKRRQE